MTTPATPPWCATTGLDLHIHEWFEVAAALCEVLLNQGHYKMAREHGQAALDALSLQVAPLVCARVHESLAWVARTEGDRNQAYAHFEQAWTCAAPMDPAYAH